MRHLRWILPLGIVFALTGGIVMAKVAKGRDTDAATEIGNQADLSLVSTSPAAGPADEARTCAKHESGDCDSCPASDECAEPAEAEPQDGSCMVGESAADGEATRDACAMGESAADGEATHDACAMGESTTDGEATHDSCAMGESAADDEAMQGCPMTGGAMKHGQSEEADKDADKAAADVI